MSNHEPQYLTPDEKQRLVKNEYVVSEKGNVYVCVSSPGDRGHPELQQREGLLCDYHPTRIFKDRRAR